MAMVDVNWRDGNVVVGGDGGRNSDLSKEGNIKYFFQENGGHLLQKKLTTSQLKIVLKQVLLANRSLQNIFCFFFPHSSALENAAVNAALF